MRGIPIALASMVILAGCSQKLPDAYGVYAKSGGTYYKLQAGSATSVPDSGTQIFIFDPTVPSLSADQLSGVVHKRYDLRLVHEEMQMTDGRSIGNTYKPGLPFSWETASIQVEVSPEKRQPSAVWVKPAGGFAAGHYMLILPTGNFALDVGSPPPACEDEIVHSQQLGVLQGLMNIATDKTPMNGAVKNTEFVSCDNRTTMSAINGLRDGSGMKVSEYLSQPNIPVYAQGNGGPFEPTPAIEPAAPTAAPPVDTAAAVAAANEAAAAASSAAAAAANAAADAAAASSAAVGR